MDALSQLRAFFFSGLLLAIYLDQLLSYYMYSKIYIVVTQVHMMQMQPLRAISSQQGSQNPLWAERLMLCIRETCEKQPCKPNKRKKKKQTKKTPTQNQPKQTKKKTITRALSAR